MDNLLDRLLDTEDLKALNHPEALAYLAVALVIFVVGRAVYATRIAGNLTEELAKNDNKAIAITFTGFMFGLGLILWGVLKVPPLEERWLDLADTAMMGVIGILLLSVSQIINDKLMFPSFDMGKQLADKNLGAGLAGCGSYIGTALIVMECVSVGRSSMFEGQRFADLLIFFVLGQVAFVLFAVVYQRVTAFDLQAEIEQANPAAGASFGLTMIAMGILLAHAIRTTDSLAAFGAMVVIAVVLLMVLRKFVDLVLLPGHDLDEEISRDRNWGTSSIEGGIAIAVALIITAAL